MTTGCDQLCDASSLELQESCVTIADQSLKIDPAKLTTVCHARD